MKRCVLALLVASCAKEPPAPSADAGATMSPNLQQILAGLEQYDAAGCASCHCNAAQGGCNIDAPSIVKSSRASVLANLRYAETAEQYPTEDDPVDAHPLKLYESTDAQIDALTAFLGSLASADAEVDDSLIGRGYRSYLAAKCIDCHLMSALGNNSGGIGSPIAGNDPDNLYTVLTREAVPCHPVKDFVPSATVAATCLLPEGRFITDLPEVTRLTDTKPPDTDDERVALAYFLSFIQPPPPAASTEPCKKLPGTICTVAGTGVGAFAQDDVPATETPIYYPMDLDLTDWNADGTLDLAIVDWNNHRIRVVYLDKEIGGITDRMISIAGTGKVTGADALNHPTDIAFDADGSLVIATWHNQNVYRYENPNRIMGRPVRTGKNRDQLAGICDLACTDHTRRPALAWEPTLGRGAFLGLPVSVAIHPGMSRTSTTDDTLIFSENACSRITAIQATGARTVGSRPPQCIEKVNLYESAVVRTIAGRPNAARMSAGLPLYHGDDGPASGAIFNPFTGPTLVNFGIALSADGSRLYVADSLNNIIRVIEDPVGPNPTVRHYAGTRPRDGRAQAGFRDGAADQALFNLPSNLALDAQGNLYVTDARNHALRRIDAVTREVTTVAGIRRASYNGDNIPAGEAALNSPNGVVVHPDGRIFVSDTNNNRIRVIFPR